MSRTELWSIIAGSVMFAGVWVTLSGIILMVLSVAMVGLGPPK